MAGNAAAAFVAGSSARVGAAANARRGRRRARRFIGLKRLKRLKEFKVERVKGKVAERGGGGVNAEC